MPNSCLNIYLRQMEIYPFDFLPSFCWTACKVSLLDYFRDISRDNLLRSEPPSMCYVILSNLTIILRCAIKQKKYY